MNQRTQYASRKLQARGIELLIVPTPVKPMVHPEMLGPGAISPAENASFARFTKTLEGEHILVFDITKELAAAAHNGSQFLAKDTHWRPEAMDLAATELAQFVTKRVELPQSIGIEYARTEARISGHGDLADMLESRQPNDLETVTIHPVLQPDRQPWAPRPQAEILWLGDSFSNIYSAEPMGWGAAAGFAEQFSYHLDRPIDALCRNDDGAFATRQMLADDLARGSERLAGKKLAIWQFAARELSQGDWKSVELKLIEHPARRLLVPPTGETWIIEGIVSAKGTAPRPGNVAYRDHILAVHLIDVAIDGKSISGGEAIIYLRSMADGKLTDAANLQLGQRIKLKARDWSEVSRRYEFMNRSDLPDPALRSQPACWGELLR